MSLSGLSLNKFSQNTFSNGGKSPLSVVSKLPTPYHLMNSLTKETGLPMTLAIIYCLIMTLQHLFTPIVSAGTPLLLGIKFDH